MQNFNRKTSWAAALLLALTTTQVLAQTIHGRVVSVADGDTLTILMAGNEQRRIRLAEIDAPESQQPFGQRSKQELTRLCAQKPATAKVDSTDRYGRTIGRVHCNGVDTSAAMVSAGLAWVYDSYNKDKSLYALQDQARAARKGLWQEPSPIQPWNWRKGQRPAGNATTTQQPANASASQTVIRGNRNSMVYHLSHCASYNAMNPANIQPFKTEKEAQQAGFRKAGNCQ